MSIHPIYLQALGIERKPNETEEELAKRISKFTKSHTITDDDLKITKKEIYDIYKHAASKTIVSDNVVLDRIDSILAHFAKNETMTISEYIELCYSMIIQETKKQITYVVENKLSELIGENVCLTEHVEFKKKKIM